MAVVPATLDFATGVVTVAEDVLELEVPTFPDDVVGLEDGDVIEPVVDELLVVIELVKPPVELVDPVEGDGEPLSEPLVEPLEGPTVGLLMAPVADVEFSCKLPAQTDSNAS